MFGKETRRKPNVQSNNPGPFHCVAAIRWKTELSNGSLPQLLFAY